MLDEPCLRVKNDHSIPTLSFGDRTRTTRLQGTTSTRRLHRPTVDFQNTIAITDIYSNTSRVHIHVTSIVDIHANTLTVHVHTSLTCQQFTFTLTRQEFTFTLTRQHATFTLTRQEFTFILIRQ